MIDFDVVVVKEEVWKIGKEVRALTDEERTMLHIRYV